MLPDAGMYRAQSNQGPGQPEYQERKGIRHAYNLYKQDMQKDD